MIALQELPHRLLSYQHRGDANSTGKLYLFVAIDRISKFASTELHTKASKMEAAEFLRNLFKTVPYRIHTVLTDNGLQFTNRTGDRYVSEHIFDRVCTECGIEHRLTKIKHPGTNEQMNRSNGGTEGLKQLLSNGFITTITVSYALTLIILLLYTTSAAD